METESIRMTTAGQIKASVGLKPIDGLCLFVPLLIFLAVLSWATWEIRLVKPMAFTLFVGLMAAGLVLAIADVWSRRAHNTCALSLKPVPESVCLSTPIGQQIKRSRPIKDVPFIIVERLSARQMPHHEV